MHCGRQVYLSQSTSCKEGMQSSHHPKDCCLFGPCPCPPPMLGRKPVCKSQAWLSECLPSVVHPVQACFGSFVLAFHSSVSQPLGLAKGLSWDNSTNFESLQTVSPLSTTACLQDLSDLATRHCIPKSLCRKPFSCLSKKGYPIFNICNSN